VAVATAGLYESLHQLLQTTTPAPNHSIFTGRMPCHPTNSVKALKATNTYITQCSKIQTSYTEFMYIPSPREYADDKKRKKTVSDMHGWHHLATQKLASVTSQLNEFTLKNDH